MEEINANDITEGTISSNSVYQTEFGFHGPGYNHNCYPWTYPSTTTTSFPMKVKCKYCNADTAHLVTTCPRVRRVAFHPDGAVAEVYFDETCPPYSG